MPLQYISSEGTLHLRDTNVRNKTIVFDDTFRAELDRRVAAAGLTTRRGPLIRAFVLSRLPSRRTASTMAPKGPPAVIDLCDGDDERPAKSGPTRRPEANSTKRPKVVLVPPPKENSSKRPSKDLGERTSVSPRKVQDHGPSTSRADSAKSSGVRTSMSKPSTQLPALAAKPADMKEMSRGTNKTSGGGADKPRVLPNGRSFTAPKDMQKPDDSSYDELPSAHTFINSQTCQRPSLTSDTQRDKRQSEADSSDLMRLGGTKRSREDVVSKLEPVKKRQRLNADIRNGESKFSSSSDSGFRHSKFGGSLSTQTDRAKNPHKKSQSGATVDLTTPTKTSASVRVVNLLSDEDEEDESRPHPDQPSRAQHSALPGKSLSVKTSREPTPHTSAAKSGVEKRLPKTPDRSSTGLSTTAHKSGREPHKHLTPAKSAPGTAKSADNNNSQKPSSSIGSRAMLGNGQPSARSVDTGVGSARGSVPEPRKPPTAVTASQGASKTLGSRPTESVTKKTSDAVTPKAPKSGSLQGTESALVLNNAEPASPSKAADTASVSSLPSRGHARVSDEERISQEKPEGSEADQGYASLDSNDEAAAEGSKNTALLTSESSMPAHAGKDGEVSALKLVRSKAPTKPVDVDQSSAAEKTPALNAAPAKVSIAATEPLGARATAQAVMPGASASAVDTVTLDPASVPSDLLRDSASPLDHQVEAPDEDGSKFGENPMVVTNGNSVGMDGGDVGATPVLKVHDPARSKAALSALGLSKQVEIVLGKYLEEMRGDNEYWNKTWLGRARLSHERSKPNIGERRTADTFAAKTEEPHSFAAMKPLQLRPGGKVTSGETSAQLTVEKMASSTEKSTKTVLSVPVALFHIEDRMPNYSHAVNIKGNFLAPNTTNLQYWPYFGDNFDFAEAESLKEQYNLDIHERPRKLLRLLQAQKLEDYVEDALQELGLAWDDVLRFLLEAEPDVGSDLDAKQALRERYRSCSEDFFRKHQRTAIVLSSLNPSSPDKLAKAAVLCENFYKMSWISLWHVARRHQLRAVPDDEDHDKTDLVNELTCRVCLRFDCPYHGEIDEHEDSEEDEDASSESAADSAVVTDIICPAKVNYRTRVAFSQVFEPAATAELSTAQKKDRHIVEYWQGKEGTWKHEADQRGPFYPLVDPVNRYNDHAMVGRCRNASVQRGVPKRTLLGDSGVHGFGLYAGENIRQHEFVGEYKGEVITKEEAERRGAVYEFQKLSYLFSLNNKQEIDSTYFGNKIRFINHGGNGGNTLYPRIFLVNTVHRIALYAERNIDCGEELLFDYGPKFPNEQLGGKPSAPRVRNSALVRDFYEVEYGVDASGNRRARKAVKPKGRPRKSDDGGAAGGPKKRGGARPGAGRKPHKSAPQPAPLEEDDDDLDVDRSAEARLVAFNISDDVEEDAMDVDAFAGAEEDDVFQPGESGDDASEASEEEEDDEGDEMASNRFRGARSRPVAGRRRAL
ncbi:hypothetical protein LTR85_009513 [Meristemomyces frigidus]|nr:hypothetical protein LTR85_009513 [Meristemomyces frigidus]